MLMPRSSQEEKGDGAVSSIISRLMAKGGSLLTADDLQRLRRLEVAAAEIEELVAEHKSLAVALRPHTSSLDTLKPTLSQAEDVLDDVVERQRRIVDLPADTNPFFEPSWAGKKLHTVLSTVFHAGHAHSAAPELKNLAKKVHKVQGFIEEADKHFTTSFPPDLKSAPPKVIGRDAECRKIVAALHLVDGNEDEDDGRPYSVLGIHGAAGSGKTTLAQCAYARAQAADEDRSGSFDISMWVHVGRRFTQHKIFHDMLEAATGRPPSSALVDRDSDDTVALLQDELRGKRILLVLDDVHSNGNDTDLKQILSPLDVVGAGSKVLVTARSVDALLVLGADISSCLAIRDLDDDVFARLFMHYALADDGVDERDRGILEFIGAGIAAKLKSSPLAAELVGTELRARPQIDVWKNFRDTISAA
ncbi:putative disease resistance protein At3g14460 [Lolium perenne]|uniref:putative disease resistance protein At3g14460 n=1 Tax=Lolium perenne TaxID=4522 RepID=UPI0021F61356|nr:uncharacterized protein LOC127309795 [Lolium perenne]